VTRTKLTKQELQSLREQHQAAGNNTVGKATFSLRNIVPAAKESQVNAKNQAVSLLTRQKQDLSKIIQD